MLTHEPQWFLLTVKSRHEKKVAMRLALKGFEVLCPTYTSMRQWSDRVKQVEFPLFPSQLFCRYSLQDRLAVFVTPGILGHAPIHVADAEIDHIRKVVGSGYALQPVAAARPWDKLCSFAPG